MAKKNLMNYMKGIQAQCTFEQNLAKTKPLCKCPGTPLFLVYCVPQRSGIKQN